MNHPAYSLDLSPCTFWILSKIRKRFRGRNLQGMNEVDADIQEQIEGLRKEDALNISSKE